MGRRLSAIRRRPQRWAGGLESREETPKEGKTMDRTF
jgi:hypothetical protein